MEWTPDMDEQAERMWGDGAPASAIASAFGTVTRNAVIGRAHRKGWARSGAPRHQTRPRIKKKVVEQSQELTVPKRRPSLVPLPPVPLPKEPSPPPKDWVATILTVQSGQCKFPLTDRWPWPLCGAPAVAFSPYCADHAAICFSGRR